jgi:hypothetical protein
MVSALLSVDASALAKALHERIRDVDFDKALMNMLSWLQCASGEAVSMNHGDGALNSDAKGARDSGSHCGK